MPERVTRLGNFVCAVFAHFYLHCSVWLPVCIAMLVCVPLGNECSASLLAGPGNTELFQLKDRETQNRNHVANERKLKSFGSFLTSIHSTVEKFLYLNLNLYICIFIYMYVYLDSDT